MLSNYFCSNHAWVSYIGFTEAYNDATENVSPMWELNIPKSPGEYITLSTRYRLQFAIVCSYFVTFIYSDLCLQFSDTACLSLDRRITSSAFIMHELEEECRDRNLQWSFNYGNRRRSNWQFDGKNRETAFIGIVQKERWMTCKLKYVI